MRKIFGVKVVAAFLVISLGFRGSLLSAAAFGGTEKEDISIPKSMVQEPDEKGKFLLAFDISGSIWKDGNGKLAEDFKNIYLYLSEQPWAVEHEAILFHERDMLLSKIRDGKYNNKTDSQKKVSSGDWKTRQETDLKNAFSRVRNYLGGITNEEKDWVQLVMISDFYDSYTRGEESERLKNDIDKLRNEFTQNKTWELYSDYFVFDSKDEAEHGYSRYEIFKAGDTHVTVEKIMNNSENDEYGVKVRVFVNSLLKGLSGDRDLKWREPRYLTQDDLEQCREYFVYSDREIAVPEKLQEDIWHYQLNNGGYLYHVSQIRMLDLGINRSTNEYYILIMPQIKAHITFTMMGNESAFVEGQIEVKLVLEDDSSVRPSNESFQILFKADRHDDIKGNLKEVTLNRQNKSFLGTVKLDSGDYTVTLKGSNGKMLLDQLIEESFIIGKKGG